ncbi:hypothetical protein L9F63_020732, partial [Diploptera punctata]
CFKLSNFFSPGSQITSLNFLTLYKIVYVTQLSLNGNTKQLYYTKARRNLTTGRLKSFPTPSQQGYRSNTMVTQEDNIWNRVSEMVGYFNTEEGTGRQQQQECAGGPMLPEHNTEEQAPVKRLVCSPDLPVFSLTQAFEEAAAAAVVESSTSVSSSPPVAAPVVGDKLYECSFCHKTFPQKNTYQNHLRSHGKEGEDPYQCNICGKTFAVPARLTRHYRTHTGEKPYQCEYCSKSFSVKENLSVHRRIHTKERPYKCDICARAFEHSGKLPPHAHPHGRAAT